VFPFIIFHNSHDIFDASQPGNFTTRYTLANKIGFVQGNQYKVANYDTFLCLFPYCNQFKVNVATNWKLNKLWAKVKRGFENGDKNSCGGDRHLTFLYYSKNPGLLKI